MCDLLTPRNEHEETFGISEALYTGPTCEDCRRPTTEYGVCPDCLSLRQELEDNSANALRLLAHGHEEKAAKYDTALPLLRWFIQQFQGDSGTGDAHWAQFPEYAQAKALCGTPEVPELTTDPARSTRLPATARNEREGEQSGPQSTAVNTTTENLSPKVSASAGPDCAQPLGSTFRWCGDEYHKIADLGDGWALIAHPNGPAISNGDAISVIDIYDGETIGPREIKLRAQRAFREWAWPRLKAGITFPDWSNEKLSD